MSDAEGTENVNYTEYLRIDETKVKAAKSLHAQDLEDLHQVFSGDLWPREEAAPPVNYEGVPFYPGRVLISTEDSDKIWACLRRMTTQGSTSVQIFHDNSEQADPRNFRESELAPWCRLLCDTYRCGGYNVAWEERLKTILKLVMLENGRFDGHVETPTNSKLPAILKTIRQNLETSKTDRFSDSSELTEVPEMLEAADHEDNEGRAQNTSEEGLIDAATCITSLKLAVPPEHWFKVEHLQDPNSHPGKVFIGQYRQPSGSGQMVSIWACVKLDGPVRCGMVIIFDDNEEQMSIEAVRPEQVDIAPVFLLLAENQADVGGGWNWKCMARTCVRLALIDAGFVDANKLKIKCRPYAQPQSIVDVVRKNLASKQAAQNKTRASLKNTDRPFTLHRRTGTSVSTTPLACTTRSMASVPQDSSSSDSSKAKLSERIANQTAVDQGTSGRILRAGGTNRTSIVDFGAPSDSETEERTTRHLSSSIRRKRGYHTENTSPFDEAGPLNIKRQRASHYNSLSLLDDLDGIAIPKPNAAARAALEDQIRELKETKAALAADIDDKEEKLERHAEFIAELQHEAAGYQEQIQDLTKQNDNLTKQKGSLASQNDSLTKQNESLSTQTNSQSARIDNLFKQNQGLFDRVEAQSEKLSKVMLKNDELEEFKSAHVMHSQPVLLELMTRKNRTNGSDEERAALDARVQYRDIYGVDPVE